MNSFLLSDIVFNLFADLAGQLKARNTQKRADEISPKLIIESKQNEGALVSMLSKITQCGVALDQLSFEVCLKQIN